MAIGVFGGFGYFAEHHARRMFEPEFADAVSTRAAEAAIAAGWFVGIVGAELLILALISGPVFGIPLP